MLRHSVPHYLSNLEALRVEWQNSMPQLPSTPEQRNGNINLSKYFISLSGDWTHNQSVLQAHFVPLRQDWPQKYMTIINKYFTTLHNFFSLTIFSLIGGSDYKLIYRHYATLYFVFCVDSSESELGILDLIQVSCLFFKKTFILYEVVLTIIVVCNYCNFILLS